METIRDSCDTLRNALLKKMRENPIQFVPYKNPEPETRCQFGCPICGGSGYLRHDVTPLHPDFGKLFSCPNLNLSKVVGDKSGLVDSERQLAFSDVWNIGDTYQARDAVMRILEKGSGWLYIWGGYGQAKTLLLKIAVAEYLRRGRIAEYVRMSSIMDNLRDAFSTDEPDTPRLKRWSEVPLLCIDEFDRMRETEYATERRFTLMDQRYVMAERGEQITIMAGNFDPIGISGYLSDRISDGRWEVIRVKGDSVRPALRDY